jgi:hypothetical protein
VTDATRASQPAKEAENDTVGFARTRDGAVSAAVAYVGSLDGRVLLDPAALSQRLAEIASSEAREGLVAHTLPPRSRRGSSSASERRPSPSSSFEPHKSAIASTDSPRRLPPSRFGESGSSAAGQPLSQSSRGVRKRSRSCGRTRPGRSPRSGASPGRRLRSRAPQLLDRFEQAAGVDRGRFVRDLSRRHRRPLSRVALADRVIHVLDLCEEGSKPVGNPCLALQNARWPPGRSSQCALR